MRWQSVEVNVYCRGTLGHGWSCTEIVEDGGSDLIGTGGIKEGLEINH